MNKKKIITLFVVLLALLGVLVLVMALPDANDKNDGEVDLPSDTPIGYGEKVYNAPMDSIDNVIVSYEGSAYSFQKNDGSWICPEKTGISISSSRITSLITEISSLRYQDKLDTSSVSPADCGITDESNSVTFTSSIGEISVFLGNDVANSSLCYIMTDISDDIYMVEKEAVSKMFSSFDEYRNSDFCRIDFENITDIKYSIGDISFSLKKGETDKDNGDFYAWEMTSPLTLSARDEEVDKLFIKPITEMSIEAYVSDDGDYKNYGITGDSFVSYTDVKGKVQTIFVSPLTENKYYLAIEGDKTIYMVSSLSVPFYGISFIDFVDRQLYLNKQSNVDFVTIEGEGVSYEVKFDSDKVILNGEEFGASGDVRNIFSSVFGLMADDISTDPTGSTKLSITYKLKDGSEVTLLFADADERYYKVSKNGQPLYIILKNKVQSMIDSIADYKE